MDLAKLNEWLQVVGLFGVMASLVFVGLQIKQDRDIALAAAFQARTATVAASFDARAANYAGLAAEIKTLGMNPDDPVTDSIFQIEGLNEPVTELEYRAGFFSAASTWAQWDNSYFQYEAGFLPESHWMRIRAVIKRNFARKTFNSLIYSGVVQRPTFRAEISDIITEVESEGVGQSN